MKLLGCIITLLLLLSSIVSAAEKVIVLTLNEAITPLTAGKIRKAIDKTQEEKAECLVIKLDTPGGLVTSTRKIVKMILNSSVPIVVYVAPAGARAASAGTFIVLSSHIAAMSPGTNIGAAHPVTMGKKMDKIMAKKMENDLAAFARSLAKLRGRNANWAEKAVRESVSVTAEEAVKLKVVDLIASNLPELLDRINGRKVKTSLGIKTLYTKQVEIIHLREDLRGHILRFITDPNIAYILLMIGLAGLYFELSHPGAILPGVVGAISLILAFYAMHIIPVNYAGLMLILFSGVLFFLEIKITSYGLLGLAGLISLILGSLMLFGKNPQALRISYNVLLPVVITVGLFLSGVTYLAAKAVLKRPTTGAEGLIGEKGEAITHINNKGGQVFVHGEIWQAISEQEIEKGEIIIVETIEGLRLKVKPLK